MEIAIHQFLDSPFVEIIPSGAARVHIPFGMGVAELSETLGDQLLGSQLDAATRLLSDDAAGRTFENHPEFLLVKFAD